MIRITAAAVALVLLLGACQSDEGGKGGAVPPTVPPMPELTHMSGPDEPTTTNSQAALPLPKGCDMVSAATVRKSTGITGAGEASDSDGFVGCTYMDASVGRTLLVEGSDIEMPDADPAAALDQLSNTLPGTPQALPGIGDAARLAIYEGTTANAIAVQRIGTHYRVVQVTASTVAKPLQWREALTPILREGMTSMLK